jgi:hypothetical protein
MANMVWTVTDSATGEPIMNAEVSGNYSSGPNPGWGNTCSTGPGSPVQAYTDESGQAIVGIPYTCGGGNYSVTVKASGYDDQSVTTPLGFITGDVDQPIQMVAGSGIGGPPGQGVSAGLTSVLDTGAQAWGEYLVLAVLAIVIVIGTVVAWRSFA